MGNRHCLVAVNDGEGESKNKDYQSKLALKKETVVIVTLDKYKRRD